jgi:transcriptional regulator with PAS, ATPase and Fis domain
LTVGEGVSARSRASNARPCRSGIRSVSRYPGPAQIIPAATPDSLAPAVPSTTSRRPVVQEREFEPLGSEHSQRVDLRVIAATNRDLKQMVAEGRFLEDLYYRLNVIPMVLPPLRERREDVPVLIEHFIRKHTQRTGKRVERLEDAALERMEAYAWPGNVRELENVIERAVVLSIGPIITASMTAVPTTAQPSPSLPSLNLRRNLQWAERETVERALAKAGGVKKDAAALMGISQRALSHYLAKLRID